LKDFIIPAIDLFDGKAVRLTRGDFGSVKVYSEKPEELARTFADAGFSRLHVVDLQGARGGELKNLRTILRIREAFPGRIQLGGGVRDYETAKRLFDEGIDVIVVGTLAYKNPEEFVKITEDFPGRVILSVDSKGGRVAVGGWKEETSLSPEEFARRYERFPIWGYLYTLIERDGSLSGTDPEPYRRFSRAVRKPVIASGGVASVEDVKKLVGVVDGVVVGKAIYEGRIDISAL